MDFVLQAMRLLSGAFLVLGRTHPYPGRRPPWTVEVAPHELSRFSQALVARNRRMDAYDQEYDLWMVGNAYCVWWCAFLVLLGLLFAGWRF